MAFYTPALQGKQHRKYKRRIVTPQEVATLHARFRTQESYRRGKRAKLGIKKRVF